MINRTKFQDTKKKRVKINLYIFLKAGKINII